MKILRILPTVLCLAALHPPCAQAGNQVIADTTLVSGSSSTVFSFQASGAGVATVQLTNIDWPQTLSSLSFVAATPGQVLSQWSATPATGTTTGTLTFQVPTGGTYFADVMATAGGPLDFGVYSLSVNFTPNAVPLPASGWLLLGGLMVGAALLFVRRPRAPNSATAP